jgi:cellulose synthase/poly-beta-1,6-N-acetylglucosamine synthase-like glycosyltransferase
MIGAVGVVIPARDERDGIVACVRSVLASLDRLPPGVESAVCVVADRCRDDTAELAARAGRGIVDVVSNRRSGTIGEVRALGVRRVRWSLSRHVAERIWLLSTDADTTVPPDWAVRHLELAGSGVHAVAGEAVLAGSPPIPATVTRRYSAVVAAERGPEGHGNVYAANLGVRADAYERVGGFAPIASGEDRDLWSRLCRTGHRCEYADEPTVLTSARTEGRAPGGLAALLAGLADAESA